MKFEISPYVGPLPLRLGMTEAEVSGLLGAPTSKRKNHSGGMSHNHGFCSVGYDQTTSKANFFGFGPPTEISYKGVQLFNNPQALGFMIAEDGDPFEFVGFMLLLNLGVQLAGFHDDNESELAVSTFEKGRFEKFRAQFTPFRTP